MHKAMLVRKSQKQLVQAVQFATPSVQHKVVGFALLKSAITQPGTGWFRESLVYAGPKVMMSWGREVL